MSIKKQYLKTKSTCKVSFRLTKSEVRNAAKVSVVGDFNEWDKVATPMRRLKNGSFSLQLNLERGNNYQFRYLLDNNEWMNDPDADGTAPTPFGDEQNSVLVV